MKDKEMIEEMAKCKHCYERFGKCPIKDKTTCTDWTRAVNQYEQGYRKLPEDSVVLSKGAYESLSSKAKANVVNAVEIRKETAEKILKDLYREATSNVIETVELTTFQIEQLAKQFGLEIKE